MPDYNGNILYLHPALHNAIDGILAEIKRNLPQGWDARVSPEGVHRTPAEQFEIFKRGKVFKNGKWVKTGTVYTSLDGFAKKSRHNYLPSQAVDIILVRPDGSVLEAGPQEKKIGTGAAKFGFDWGGNWDESFQDLPHIEIPKAKLFKASFDQDEALQWQKYLFAAGALSAPDDLDGFFGAQSKDALERVIGSRECTPATWQELFVKYGPIEDLPQFKDLSWVPPVK